jgi:hypothetical protein
MFAIEISKILPLFPNQAYIEFEVSGVEHLSVPLPTLTFYIQRSESPQLEDSWELLNSSGTTKYYYIDQATRLLSFYQSIYYRAYVTRQLRRDEFLRRRKILYDEEIVLRKFSGRKMAILKRRHIGDRCDVCFDPNTKSVTKSHCSVCKGTGFKEPYYTPFTTYGARLPVVKEVEEQSDSGSETDYTKMQFLDYPTIHPQDLIIDLEVNDRYKVNKIEPTEMKRHTVHQEVIMTKLARTSAEYSIPIDNSLLELPTSIEL